MPPPPHLRDLAFLRPPALLAAVRDVAGLVRAAGGRAFLVGGAVRDALLGAEAKDADMEVFGVPADRLREILSAKYSLGLAGLSFGVLKLHHLDIDVSLPRRESKRGLGHRGFDVLSDPGLGVGEAASRRDFTINAIYLDPLSLEVLDPFRGIADLGERRLRHVSGKFAEDPLRVLRGMQFVARFDLDPDPATVEACRAMAPEGLPPERLFGEWGKLLVKGVKISKGLTFLRDVGWVRHYPELAALIGCKQDPGWHPEGDVWDHTLACLDAFARRRTGDRLEDLVVGLAVLCHDFGKPATTQVERGHIRSPGHDEAGGRPALDFLRRLTSEERILREVPPLVVNHMQPFALWRAQAGDAAVRRLAMRVGRLDRLLRVARADAEGCQPPPGGAAGEDLRWLADAAERLRVADAAPKPILMGRDLVALGLAPSPRFGKWLAACFEAQLDGAFADRDGAVAYFRRHFGDEAGFL